MSVSRWLYLSLIAAAVLVVSCGPIRPQLGEPVSQDFADRLIENWSANSSRISSVQGLAKVKVQAPLNAMNGTQVVLAEKPNRLRTETLSPFGTPLLLLAADGENLVVSLPAQNLYYIGPATPENLGLFVNIPMELSDLVNVLLYQPSLIEAWQEEAFTLKEGGWLLIRRGTSKRQELVFDQMHKLVEMSYFDNNDLVVKVNYDRFAKQTMGGDYPEQLTLVLPAKHATISLEFTDVGTNGHLRPGIFELTPPEGARVVYFPDQFK